MEDEKKEDELAQVNLEAELDEARWQLASKNIMNEHLEKERAKLTRDLSTAKKSMEDLKAGHQSKQDKAYDSRLDEG